MRGWGVDAYGYFMLHQVGQSTHLLLNRVDVTFLFDFQSSVRVGFDAGCAGLGHVAVGPVDNIAGVLSAGGTVAIGNAADGSGHGFTAGVDFGAFELFGFSGGDVSG